MSQTAYWRGIAERFEGQLTEARAENDKIRSALRAGHSGRYWEIKRDEMYLRWKDARAEIERLESAASNMFCAECGNEIETLVDDHNNTSVIQCDRCKGDTFSAGYQRCKSGMRL